ncbi:MAG: PAS domain S-box protein [Chloroflexi bacterium]|nr:PAS domain S-box protein [Chloroflexota bacterium]MCI0579528.1 PAS domain S-box protein [Chloroflexota bacterium]MCI0644432.1 PAS domain S-box protein [Chloroflexota bacterium]MCI0725403.1 PAS domain S-box protein [Chloroflexota bacterium]
MNSDLRILMLEDVPTDAELAERMLRKNGLVFTAQRVESEAAFVRALESFAPHLILADYSLPSFDGLSALTIARRKRPDVPFILISATLGEERAIEALKLGATDYVVKQRLERLPSVVERALREVEERRERQQAEEALQESQTQLTGIIGSAMDAIISVDADHKIILFNRAAERLFGYPAADMIGQALDRLIPERFRQAHQEHVQRFGQTGVTNRSMGASGNLYGLRADGSEMPLETSISQIEIGGQKIYTVIVRDITERVRAEKALRQSEERFSRIFHASPVAISLTALPDERFLDVNESFLRLTGYSREEIIGHSSAELNLWPDPKKQARLARSLVGKQAVYGVELSFRRKTGEIVYTLTALELIELASQQCVLTLAHDITERKQREQQLEAIATVSAALRVAQTRSEMFPVILEEVSKLLKADGAALAMRDPATGEAVIVQGYGAWTILTGDRVTAGTGLSGHVLATGQPYWNNDISTEPRFTRPDVIGELRAVACVPLTAREQTIGALWIACRNDITPEEIRLLTAVSDIAAIAIYRVTLNEQTRSQARQVQQIIDTIPEGVLFLDTAQRVVMANPAARSHLALLSGADVGDAVIALGDRPLAELLKPVGPGIPWQEVLIPDARRVFEVAAQPLTAGAQVEGWVVVLRDTTEEREHERYLQAQQRLATVGQLAAGVAHDLNNVMASIVLYAQMLGYTPELTGKQRDRLAVIASQAQHASHLIHQILDFSRSSVMARSPVDLLPFLRELVKLLERTLPENIQVSLNFGRGEYVVSADLTRLQQVVMNLGVNARDAMPDGGKLRVRLQTLALLPGEKPPLPDMVPGQWIQIEVSDTGSGIRPQDLSHIFEPFFTTKPPGQGTGLGLAQVYGIVKQHDGYIHVTSEVGLGTTFTIYLPALTLPGLIAPAQAREAPAQGAGETILVVEDERQVREAVVEILETLSYRVLSAANGEQALALFEKHAREIALVFSDLVMPDMRGDALYKQLKVQNPAVKMVIATGYPLEEVGRELLNQGIVASVQKPFEIDQIAKVVQEALAG